MIIKNKPIKLLWHIIIFIILLITITFQQGYRPLNGEGNNRIQSTAGIAKTPLVRELPSAFRFADDTAKMIPTPGDYDVVPDTFTTCSAQLSEGLFPLPRCVSNKLTAMMLKDEDAYDFSRLEKFKSKRKNSHIVSL